MEDRVKIWAKYSLEDYKLRYESRNVTKFLNLIYVVNIYGERYMDFTFSKIAPNEFEIQLHEDTVIQVCPGKPIFLRDNTIICRKEKGYHTFTATTALPTEKDVLDKFIGHMRREGVRVCLVD
jgi:hypothetical protein